jgi:hypothetical protein
MRTFIKAIFGESKEVIALRQRVEELEADLKEYEQDTNVSIHDALHKINYSNERVRNKALEVATTTKYQNMSELLENADAIYKWLKQ